MSEMTEQGFGLELIEREAVLILHSDLNEELDQQESKWSDRDTEYMEATGDPLDSITLPHVEHFYYGSRPSLIEADVDKYPNVSVMCYQGNPPSTDKIDQGNDWRVQLDVEIMNNSDYSEGEVHRRTQRTAEAVNQVLVRNYNLNGLSLGFDDDPTVIISDIFSRPKEDGQGIEFYWQLARIRYNLTRHAYLPGD